MIDLSRIDFHSFNRSKNLIGSFYWRGFDENDKKKYEYNEELTHKASLLVYEYFKDYWNDFFILSGLRYCDETDDDIEKSSYFSLEKEKIYEDIYNKAKEKGWLIPFDDEYDKWANYEWFKLPKTQIPLHFLRFCFDTNFTLQFSELSALKGGESKTCGEICLLINPKLQIALYTHWDIGYACIDLGDNPKILTDFLNYCDKSKDFVSHIEEQYR